MRTIYGLGGGLLSGCSGRDVGGVGRGRKIDKGCERAELNLCK